ncbi:exosome complex protein Rrp4 [Candidatus Woesearchaeota archaeon]|nr:exosome complex protein Rrp4 [Candidatus Woesearchaeota archaeon]
MGNIIVKEKSIVVPGEPLAEGMDYLPGTGTYREGEKILAGKLGLVYLDGRTIKLITLAGRYMPKRNDTIIGKVTDVLMSGWRIDINSPYTAMLSMKDATSDYIAKGADLTKYFALGEYLVTTIVNVTSQKLVDVSMKGPGLRKLRGGRILEVNTNKVPRIIGKQGSMVTMIKDATGCKISVGQNGLIWIDGEPKMELIAVNTIKKIAEESHLSGLTDKIKAYLEKETKK